MDRHQEVTEWHGRNGVPVDSQSEEQRQTKTLLRVLQCLVEQAPDELQHPPTK